MAHDLFSSLDSFVAVPPSSLLVRDLAGEYRRAAADEVLLAAQRVLASQVRGSEVLASPVWPPLEYSPVGGAADFLDYRWR